MNSSGPVAMDAGGGSECRSDSDGGNSRGDGDGRVLNHEQWVLPTNPIGAMMSLGMSPKQAT